MGLVAGGQTASRVSELDYGKPRFAIVLDYRESAAPVFLSLHYASTTIMPVHSDWSP